MKSAPPFRGPAMPTGRGNPGAETRFVSSTKAATGQSHAIPVVGSNAPLNKPNRRAEAQDGGSFGSFKGYGPTAGK